MDTFPWGHIYETESKMVAASKKAKKKRLQKITSYSPEVQGKNHIVNNDIALTEHADWVYIMKAHNTQ